MRKSAVVLAALIALALASVAFAAGHEHKAPAPAHGHHHNDVVPHNGTTSHGTNPAGNTGHVQPHGHNLLQRLHYVVFGRYHRAGSCSTNHGAPPAHQHPHGGGHHGNEPHGH